MPPVTAQERKTGSTLTGPPRGPGVAAAPETGAAIESSNPPATTTSTHRLAEKEPVRSRTAPSMKGPAAAIVYPAPSMRPTTAPVSAGSRATSSGSVRVSGKVAPIPAPASIAHAQPASGRVAMPIVATKQHPCREAEPLPPRPEPVGEEGDQQSAGQSGDAHDTHQRARRLRAPTALLKGVGHPGHQSVVDDRLQRENRHEHPHHPPAPWQARRRDRAGARSTAARARARR